MIESGKEPNTLTEAFSAQVQESPKACAVIDECRKLSYEDLDSLSDAIASMFPEHEGFIGLVMDHSVEMIASLWAILKSGAAYVPAEPNFPCKRIQYIMAQSNASFVVTQRQYEHLFGALPCIFVDQGFNASKTSPVTPKKDIKVSPRSLAYVLYTSGTTGRPKGVAVEHRNVCHYVRAYSDEFRPTPEDTMLQNSVCSFDIFVEEVFTPLLSGGTLAIPEAHTRADVSLLMKFAQSKRVSIISGFPYLIWDINKLGNLPDSVRLLISGGDVLKAHYVNNLLDKVDIYNTYGPTETTVCATYFKCNGYTPLEDNTYPIGQVISGVSVSLRDERLNPVKIGEPGEIFISGFGVSRGYLDENENMDSFITLPDGTLVYRSGDIGCELPDGNLSFLGRKDDQVMILGKRVEPKEVECILEQNKIIEHAVVLPEVDEEGITYLTAYVVASSKNCNEQNIDISTLRSHLTHYLPEYMIPECYVQLEEMPLTSHGKIDKNTLSCFEEAR